MLARTTVRSLSLLRNSYWLGSAAVLTGTVALSAPIPLQVAAGAITLYNLCSRLDYINLNLLIDYEKRQELLLSSLKAALLQSSHFAECDPRSLYIGLPKITFADQGMIGELARNFGVSKGTALSFFTLDANYLVGNGQRSGYVNCEGRFVKKTQYRFTKIKGKEAGRRFDVPVGGEWEGGK